MNRPKDNLPRAPEAEANLIGCVILDPSTWGHVAPIVRPTDFMDPALRTLFGAIDLMVTDGVAIDPTTLMQRLRDRGDLEKIGGAATVAKVINAVPNAAHATYYAEIVKETATKRRLAALATELGRNALNGQPAADTLAQLRAELSEIEQRQQPAKPRFELMTAAQLAATSTHVPYIIQGVLAEGQPTLVAGGSKTMKTSCLEDLSIAVASGGFFLGYFPVPKAQRVLMLSGESGRATIAKTARSIADAANVDLASIDNLLFGDSLPRLADAADVRELARVIEGEAVKVLVIDPVYLAMDLDGRESSLFAVGAQLRPLSDACQELGCTLILAHHTRQSVARDNEPPQLGDASWAGFEQHARQWILLKRRVRYVPGTGEHKLWMAVGGSAGHGGLFALDISQGTMETPCWSVTVESGPDAIATVEQAKQQVQQQHHAAKVEQDAGRIAQLLAQFPDGKTARGLRDLLGISGTRFTQAIALLLNSGDVTTCTVTNGTKTYDGFRLNQN